MPSRNLANQLSDVNQFIIKGMTKLNDFFYFIYKPVLTVDWYFLCHYSHGTFNKKILMTRKPILLSRCFSLFFFPALLILAQGCSRKLQFVQSSVVPAAKGSVKIKKDNNDNYSIDLKIENLADPERLKPSKKSYVVWMETEQTQGFKNLGQLKSSTGLFSSTLKASLSTVTSFKPKRIFITAEDNTAITYPYGQTVLTTKE